MSRFYDELNKRLVYINNSGASEEYWDEHWKDTESLKDFIYNSTNRFVVGTTKKFLKKGSKILEGGCGRGQNVYLLNKFGFTCTGLDYAEETIRAIQKATPELDVVLGDVRKLPFEDNSFDGYWSLGVIEHFYDGYDDILKEMLRVLKPNGVLFLTVPTMSPLRKLKARRGSYAPHVQTPQLIENFYQFALDPDLVKEKFMSNGFALLKQQPFDGVKGLKDEITTFNGMLQNLYDGTDIKKKITRKFIDLASKKLTAHMTLYVLEKK